MKRIRHLQAEAKLLNKDRNDCNDTKTHQCYHNKAKGLSQTHGKDFGFMVKAKTKD